MTEQEKNIEAAAKAAHDAITALIKAYADAACAEYVKHNQQTGE